jgi:low temperature requirement protein LtrA
VFVFAFTQVTVLMAVQLDGRSLVRGLVLLALLWFSWCSYAWLGNQARADEGLVRTALVVAMAAIFFVALALPEAWTTTGAAVVLAVALTVVRLVHLVVYAVAAGADRGLLARRS